MPVLVSFIVISADGIPFLKKKNILSHLCSNNCGRAPISCRSLQKLSLKDRISQSGTTTLTTLLLPFLLGLFPLHGAISSPETVQGGAVERPCGRKLRVLQDALGVSQSSYQGTVEPGLRSGLLAAVLILYC